MAGVFILSSGFANADTSYLDQLITKAQSEKAYNEVGWKKILFSNLFDDPEFYLAGIQNRGDYQMEMIATLKALLSDQPIKIKNQLRHAQCYFPARFEYLKRRLQIDLKKVPHPDCPSTDKFKKFANYTGISLVFSNYFANNPASMFGHTLLRLHRSGPSEEVGLLDDAANFAANIQVMNPLTYPFKGLMGFFPGRFALLPYSSKIQEYNNYESRDLWEYELNYSPDESYRLALSLWEGAFFWMDYFYLDENCSYMMLALLETSKPELDLIGDFHLYAIPSDTVKTVTRQKGLVRQVRFKASAQTRYLERADALKPHEQKIFLDIVGRFKEHFDKEEFHQRLNDPRCDQDCQIRILDATIEYIDFSEKKISTKKLQHYQKLRPGVLLARSKISRPSPALTYRPESSRPDLGPRSSMLDFSSGWSQHGLNHSELRWRPAHHEIGSNALGYSDQLQIQILDLLLAHDEDLKKYYVKRWTPLELTSLGKHELGLSPWSWRLELLYSKDRNHKDEDRLYDRSQVQWGLGGARFGKKVGAYLMAQFAGGYSSDADLFWHAGVGPHLGAFWTLSPSLKLSGQFEWMKMYGRRSLERREASSRLAYFWHTENEAYLEFRDRDFAYYWGAGYRFYY